ncbi:transposase [Desulfofundulus sp. TPOSR]|uniref:RNA-guided endonuclease InsQ/TnpB family protein n=1 Tax=Desulfofundulus sp. TPOSR TaxID=2714340 RepID=UPI001407FAD7|nr:zinc ribbon domain-containing protein [Desulfofundulus sp. TPOSR]NHM28702.1 transposase [Desulfofundulus sp. TPOSR]
MKVKRAIRIRISSKRKRGARELACDLAQFRNLLLIFQSRYYALFGQVILNQSVIYSLLADQTMKKKPEQEEALREASERIIQHPDLQELIQRMKEQKARVDNNYVLQTTIRQVIKDYKSFLASLAEYRVNPGKYKERPQPPKPKKLGKLTQVTAEFNSNVFEVEGNTLFLRLRMNGKKRIKIKLPRDVESVSSVRLVYHLSDVWVDVIYEKELKEPEAGLIHLAGIDMGMDNLISLISTSPDVKSLIISGREIKSFNCWFNKKKAAVQSAMDTLSNKIAQEEDEPRKNAMSKELLKLKFYLHNLYNYRDRWIESHFHKVARVLADFLYETGHKAVYLGKGATESKDGIDLGKVTNQNFVSIPFRKLINILKYKLEELGMKAEEKEESYTSKASSLSDDILEIQRKYAEVKEKQGEIKVKCSGKRIERGLYRDNVLNKVFNADLNGALNILKVGAKLRRLTLSLKVLLCKLCNPLRLNLYDFIYRFKSKAESPPGIGDSRLATAGLTR